MTWANAGTVSATSAGSAVSPVMKHGFWRFDVGAEPEAGDNLFISNTFQTRREVNTGKTQQSPCPNENSSTNDTEESLHIPYSREVRFDAKTQAS